MNRTASIHGADSLQLAPGNYIVEVVPPVGYEIQKEEDKNVDFGEYYDVATQALPPECVGTRPYPVPTDLTLFPGVGIPADYRDDPPAMPLPIRPATPARSGRCAIAWRSR